MAKRAETGNTGLETRGNGKSLAVPVGLVAARQIVEILKRHGNLRFNNADDKDLALAEIAALEATDDDTPEAQTPPPPSAHTGRIVQAPPRAALRDEDDDDPRIPGTKHDGD